MERDYGQFLKSLRLEKGLSRDEIADYLCYSIQIVSNWERGTTLPPMTSWDGICKLYELNLDDFLNCSITSNYVEYEFNQKAFAKNLRKLRKKQNLTQLDIAKTVNVNNKTVSSWENGDSFPSLEAFIKLTEILNITPTELYYVVKIEKPIEVVETLSPKKEFGIWKPLLVVASLLVLVAAITVGTIFGVAANRHSDSTNGLDNYDSSYNVTSGATSAQSGTNDNNNNGSVSLTTGTTSTSIPSSTSTTQNQSNPYISYPFNTLKLKLNETYTLTPSYYPLEATVTYESLDESIVTVNSSGLVTAVGEGKTRIKSSISDTVFAYLIVRIEDYSILPIDNGAMSEEQKNFFENDKTGKVYARFYFEDKISILYEEWFDLGADFTFNFVNPRFGPFKGFAYNFLGWDIDNDGVVDSLPTKMNDNLNAVAVYSKTPTSDPDFVNMDENGISSFNTDYTYIGDDDLLIIPSIEYYLKIDDITSEFLNIQVNEVDDYLIDVNTSTNGIHFRKLVLLEGVDYISPQTNDSNYTNYSIYSSDGLDYLRLPKSLRTIAYYIKCNNTNINNEYIYIIPFARKCGLDGTTINTGFRFSNEYDRNSLTRFYPTDVLIKNNTNLKYLDFSYLNQCLIDLSSASSLLTNCPNVERVVFPEKIKYLGDITNTKISFIEINYGDVPQGLKNITSDRDITIVLPVDAVLWINAEASTHNYYFMFFGAQASAKQQALDYIDSHSNCFAYFYSNNPGNGEWTYDQNHLIILGN